MNLLITGVSSGIGRALTESLSSEHHIVGISRRNPAIPSIDWQELDLSDSRARKAWLKKAQAKTPLLDGLILNAWVGHFDRFQDIEYEKYEAMMETNLMANIELIYGLLPIIKEDATIIFIGSRASRRFMWGGAVYQASKFGLRGFAWALREEFPRLHIYFLNPSIVRTEFFQHTTAPILGRFPETPMSDILHAVTTMLSGEKKNWEVDI